MTTKSWDYAQELAARHAEQDEKYAITPEPSEWILRAATYEWRCLACDGPALLLSAAGGNLPFECDCDHTDGADVGIAVLLAGKRFELGTAADLCGPTPHPRWKPATP
jgi:hypothetical protein